jgi:hypothetical protein
VTNRESVEVKRLQELFVEITGETTLREQQHENSRAMSSHDGSSAAGEADHDLLGFDFDD